MHRGRGARIITLLPYHLRDVSISHGRNRGAWCCAQTCRCRALFLRTSCGSVRSRLGRPVRRPLPYCTHTDAQGGGTGGRLHSAAAQRAEGAQRGGAPERAPHGARDGRQQRHRLRPRTGARGGGCSCDAGLPGPQAWSGCCGAAVRAREGREGVPPADRRRRPRLHDRRGRAARLGPNLRRLRARRPPGLPAAERRNHANRMVPVERAHCRLPHGPADALL
jgi:hypothetical protein